MEKVIGDEIIEIEVTPTEPEQELPFEIETEVQEVDITDADKGSFVSITMPTSSDLVITEHVLDSYAPAQVEEDEVLSSGWKKRVVVITGASKGIGAQTAQLFSLYADIVYNLSRTRGEDDTINWIKTDVTNASEVQSAMQKIYEKEGQIDLLINNAGQGHAGSAEGATPEDVAYVLSVNIVGIANCVAAAVPFMRERGKGRIINIASLAGVFVLPFQSFYSASKAAVIAYSNALRTELAPQKIRVTCVLFNEVKTTFTENKLRNANDDKVYKYRMAKSVGKYDFAEQAGHDPKWIARQLFKLSNKRKLRPLTVFGRKNKFRMFMRRFISQKALNRAVSRKY